jgi:outer membrane protein OmpA-like peptidoglycan-associated protein
MISRLITCLALIGAQFLLVRPLHAWDPEAPDDPEAQKAAIAALARAPEPQKLKAEIRDVPGITRDIDSQGVGLLARVESIEKAMEDLGAEVMEQEIRVALSADLLFDFDQHDLKPEAEAELTSLALLVREKSSGTARIYGHTDARGSEEYNQALSERRAKSVRQWLIEHGDLGPDIEIETRGMGEGHPVAPNTNPDGSDNAEGRALNRRVEVSIDTKSQT